MGAALVAACLLGCPRPGGSVAPSPTEPALERWVDGSAVEGGDGTAALPFKRLEPALAPGAVIHLLSGLYEGPWDLPAGVRLVGQGQAVLFAQGETTVVSASSATLEHLSIQGGFLGLEANGAVSLREVHFSGHRRVALAVSGTLKLEDSALEGTVSDTQGVKLLAGAQARLRRVRFTGAFRHALAAEDAQLEAEELQFEGPAQALHLERSRARIRTLAVAGGSGPAVFVAGGSLGLADASVSGHEYGLLARQAELKVERFTSRRVQLAGLATVGCTGTLATVTTEHSGGHGGLQLLDSTLTVKGVKVTQGRSVGVLIRKGKVSLEDVTVEQVRADADGSGGDGLQLRDAEVEASRLLVRDVEGVGVFASAGARVTLKAVTCERCRVGALVSELASTVKVQGLTTRGGEGPAIAALDRATVRVEGADLTTAQSPVWAECEQGAQVTLERFTGNLPLAASPCIHSR